MFTTTVVWQLVSRSCPADASAEGLQRIGRDAAASSERDVRGSSPTIRSTGSIVLEPLVGQEDCCTPEESSAESNGLHRAHSQPPSPMLTGVALEVVAATATETAAAAATEIGGESSCDCSGGQATHCVVVTPCES